MRFIPNDIINIIFEYYINSLEKLVFSMYVLRDSYTLTSNELYKKYTNNSSCKQALCLFIQNSNREYIRILLSNIGYIVTKGEFNDISKYSSRKSVEAIFKYNREKLCLYGAIHEASCTQNNDTLEGLYYLL